MKNFLSRTWDYLSSTIFAVIFLIIVAIISIIGTAIPQVKLFSSPLFMLLLAILGLSLFACTLKRLNLALRGKMSGYMWGAFLAHLSILIIYLGAIYGSLAGFSADVGIEKGSSYYEPRGNFYVKLNDFNAKFDKQGRPLEYSSDLSVIENDKEIVRKTIFVNKPLEYKGIRFYQSSYGLNGTLEVAVKGEKTEKIPIYKGSCATYSSTGQMFHIAELLPDLHLLHGMAIETYEPKYAVVLIEGLGWLLQDKSIKVDKYTLKLSGVKEYTGLQVKKDPGVPLVYLGFLLLTAGVAIMLYAKK